MNYVKEKIGKGLYVPQMAEKARQIGVQQVEQAEKQFPYLDRHLPSHEMSTDEKEKRLKKIEDISNGLDNIFPWSPIPIGIGSVLVNILFLVKKKKKEKTINRCNRDSFHLLVVQWAPFYQSIRVSFFLFLIQLCVTLLLKSKKYSLFIYDVGYSYLVINAHGTKYRDCFSFKPRAIIGWVSPHVL